jgi:hypothetical protein
MVHTGALEDDLSIKMDEQPGTSYLYDNWDPTFNTTKSMMNDASEEGVTEKPPDSSEDNAASTNTLAMQHITIHKMRFEEELSHLKEEHRVELESFHAAQKEAQAHQVQQEAQFIDSLKEMQDLQLQMQALQAQQEPPASSGAEPPPAK